MVQWCNGLMLHRHAALRNQAGPLRAADLHPPVHRCTSHLQQRAAATGADCAEATAGRCEWSEWSVWPQLGDVSGVSGVCGHSWKM